MLRDLTKADWLRLLELPESRIPQVLILRGTRNLRHQYQAALPSFTDVLELGAPNGVFEDVLVGKRCGRWVGFACVYGASMASEIVHLFGVLGTRAVIQTGNCGALADTLQAGDLFVAERAFCGEGAAQYYKRDGAWVSASPSLRESSTLAAAGPWAAGAIYTTGALLAESLDDVNRWFQQGFAAVDMETAATYAVAEAFGMGRISVLYAFDNPRQRQHLLLADADQDRRRAAGNAKMMHIALALAVELCGE
jgi:purine-nucleoside phosphorylase